jgi:hypothetical protein
MDQVEMTDVFGLLLSSIKDLSQIQSSVEMKYTHESIGHFQEKIEGIMKVV